MDTREFAGLELAARAKLVCHNVVRCIHEAHEMGIGVGFGGSEREEPAEEDGPRLLRFPGA